MLAPPANLEPVGSPLSAGREYLFSDVAVSFYIWIHWICTGNFIIRDIKLSVDIRMVLKLILEN